MDAIKAAFSAIWNALQNAIPIERWMAAIGNVLKYLGFAFVIVAALISLVYLNPGGGISTEQRFVIILSLILLLILTMAVVVILGMRSGDLLYSPYERSLRQGRNYGTREQSVSRREALSQPASPREPKQLPPAPQTTQIGGPQ